MIDNVMVNIGAAFMIVGGVALVAIVLSLVIYAAGWAWVAASDKWRDILRAESLIYEYRMNRDAYIKWKKNANKDGGVDAVIVTRCKDCKHLVAVNVNGKGIPTCRMSGMEVAPAEFCSRGEKERRC